MSTLNKKKNIFASITSTGMDNLPIDSDSNSIKEDKLSLLLFNESLCDNALLPDLKTGNKLPCNLRKNDHLLYNFFSVTKNPHDVIQVYRVGDWDSEETVDSLGKNPELKRISLWELYRNVTCYNTKASMFFHLKTSEESFASYNLSCNHFSNEKFPVGNKHALCNGVSEEAAFQQKAIEWFGTPFPNIISDSFPVSVAHLTNNMITMSFDFTNKIGEVFMKVFKVYTYSDSSYCFSKTYYPVTYWYCRDIDTKFPVAVGLPNKQPLYNLHLVIKAETVIICSSLENAFACQQGNSDSSVAFTAFVCDPELFSQVDFAPLRGKEVKILVVNHSGLSLAECYFKAKKLYEYLRDKIKIEQLGFIQMEVLYPNVKTVSSIDGLMTAHRKNPPRIIEKSLCELDESKFLEMLTKAKAEIQRKYEQSCDMPFWDTSESAKAVTVQTAPISENLTDKFILRPVIVGGQVTLIVSAPGTGKSCFTTALCAQIAGSSSPFITERCWTRCTPIDNPKRGYKVVYLTFDSDGSAAINEHRKDFANGLKENSHNFIQKDMSFDEVDYSQPENYNKFLEVLGEFRNQGITGQQIDVLVIDTLLAFTGGYMQKMLDFSNSSNNDFMV